MRDGVDVCHVPAFTLSIEADMSDLRWTIQTARSTGFRLTCARLMVRASALVFNQNPELHQMVCGNKLFNPAQADIALSVSGDTAVAPLMIVANANNKSLIEIASEVNERAPAVREADRVLMKTLDRWGRFVPLSFLRRALMRILFRSERFRRNGCGTFQVTMLSEVDRASSKVFSSAAVLLVGRVREKPVVYNGALAVRAMVTLTCCADHRVWDGQSGQHFLIALREILESDVLPAEIRAGLSQQFCANENTSAGKSRSTQPDPRCPAPPPDGLIVVEPRCVRLGSILISTPPSNPPSAESIPITSSSICESYGTNQSPSASLSSSSAPGPIRPTYTASIPSTKNSPERSAAKLSCS
jgi:hypothetical protein